MEKLLKAIKVAMGRKRWNEIVWNLGGGVVIASTEKQKTLPKKEKELHDIIPELIYWQEGDAVAWSEYNNTDACCCRNHYCDNRRIGGTGEYLGIYDNKVWVKSTNSEIKELSTTSVGFSKTVTNDAARKRHCEVREAEIKQNISNDHYYHSLKVIREKGLHLLEPSVQTETV